MPKHIQSFQALGNIEVYVQYTLGLGIQTGVGLGTQTSSDKICSNSESLMGAALIFIKHTTLKIPMKIFASYVLSLNPKLVCLLIWNYEFVLKFCQTDLNKGGNVLKEAKKLFYEILILNLCLNVFKAKKRIWQKISKLLSHKKIFVFFHDFKIVLNSFWKKSDLRALWQRGSQYLNSDKSYQNLDEVPRYLKTIWILNLECTGIRVLLIGKWDPQICNSYTERFYTVSHYPSEFWITGLTLPIWVHPKYLITWKSR